MQFLSSICSTQVGVASFAAVSVLCDMYFKATFRKHPELGPFCPYYRLLRVSDTPASAIKGFKDGNTIGDDYGYDANGNMIKDFNKGLGTPTANGIIYNHLNLPTKITFGTTGNIVYIYNALGQKVEKQVFTTTQGSVPSIIYYLNGFQYVFRENYADYLTKLQFFPTAEGYVKNTVVSGVNNYSYVFNYTDHLGNVRFSYQDIDKNGFISSYEILEESNYYPFGMKHSGYNSGNLQVNYKYKYNGKEYQDELGLNMYDMEARQYDPAIGRWVVQDPIVHHDVSPYVAFNNNPVYFSDPDGMDPITSTVSRTTITSAIDADGNTTVTMRKYTSTTVTNDDGSKTVTNSVSVTNNVIP